MAKPPRSGRAPVLRAAVSFATLLTALPAALALPIPSADVPKWREDLRTMAVEMPRRHKNLFHTMTPAQFEAAVAALDARIPSLERHQIIVEMARIAAMVGDGHTSVAPTRDPKIAFRTYPIHLYLFKDGLYVRSADAAHADLVGARVLRIGTASAEEAYAAAREIVGRDNEMDVKFFAPMLLSMPEVVHALGLVSDMEKASFTLEIGGRRRVVVLVAGRRRGPAFSPRGHELDQEGRLDRRPRDDRSPLARGIRKTSTGSSICPRARAVYVQFNQVGNKEDETIEAFSKRLSAFVEENPVDRLILDLRLNRGGDGSLNRPLVVALIRSVKVDRPGGLYRAHRSLHLVRGANARQRAREVHERRLRRASRAAARSITTEIPRGSRFPTAA